MHTQPILFQFTPNLNTLHHSGGGGGGGGGVVRSKAYSCIQEGGGGQKSDEFEHTYFLDAPNGGFWDF